VVNTAGRPGGAVFLIAGTSIILSDGAFINASGGGGHQVGLSYGGSGGGSGGFIGLDAPTLMIDGDLFALGGGGSVGGSATGFGPAGNVAAGPRNPALSKGGVSSCQGGGGGGGARAFNASKGGNAMGGSVCGGGGGGGSVGVIGFAGDTLDLANLDFAPTPQALP
jgi:hypothetical protein